MERLRTRRHFNHHAQRSSLPLMCLLCTLVTLAVLITDQQHGGRTIITSSTTSSDVMITTSVPALNNPMMKRGSTAVTDEGSKLGRRSLLPHTPPHWSRWNEFLIPSSPHSDPKAHRDEDGDEEEDGDEPSLCIGWRQTANCDPDDLEEPFYSQSCDAVIYKGAPSGFCLCAGGVRTHPLRCEGVAAPFTCREKCAALTANRLEMDDNGAARGGQHSKSSYYRRLEEAVWNAKDEAAWGKAVAALRAQRYRDNAARDHKCQQAWRGWERGLEPQRATQLLFVDRDGTGKPSLFLEAWPCDWPLGADGEGPLPPTATTTTMAPTERSAAALVCICGDGSVEGTDITIRENEDGSRSVTCDEHCRSTFTALHPPRLFDLRDDDEEREIEMEERSERRSTPTGGRALERAVLSDIDMIKREFLFLSEEEKSRSHPRRGPMVVKLDRDRHWQRLRDAELEHVLGPMSQRHRT